MTYMAIYNIHHLIITSEQSVLIPELSSVSSQTVLSFWQIHKDALYDSLALLITHIFLFLISFSNSSHKLPYKLHILSHHSLFMMQREKKKNCEKVRNDKFVEHLASF